MSESWDESMGIDGRIESFIRKYKHGVEKI